MRSNKDVEAYLLRMARPFNELSEGTYVVSVGSVPVALKLVPPIVVARCTIGPYPKDDHTELFRHLLQLNASSLVHAAYGLDGDNIVLVSALELENLDYNELDAVFAEIDLALNQHLAKIRELAGAKSTT
jgi:hypothetical protein